MVSEKCVWQPNIRTKLRSARLIPTDKLTIASHNGKRICISNTISPEMACMDLVQSPDLLKSRHSETGKSCGRYYANNIGNPENCVEFIHSHELNNFLKTYVVWDHFIKFNLKHKGTSIADHLKYLIRAKISCLRHRWSIFL